MIVPRPTRGLVLARLRGKLVAIIPALPQYGALVFADIAHVFLLVCRRAADHQRQSRIEFAKQRLVPGQPRRISPGVGLFLRRQRPVTGLVQGQQALVRGIDLTQAGAVIACALRRRGWQHQAENPAQQYGPAIIDGHRKLPIPL